MQVLGMLDFLLRPLGGELCPEKYTKIADILKSRRAPGELPDCMALKFVALLVMMIVKYVQ